MSGKAVFLLLAALGVASLGAVHGVALPDRRLIMTVYVEHSTQLPAYVDKFVEHRGSVNVASALCFNPGHVAPNMTIDHDFCLSNFHQPLRQRAPEIMQLPIIQMANEVALYNIEHFGWFTEAFVNAALKYDIDGYLVNAEVAHGNYDEGKVFANFLRYFGETLHSHNKTLGVFLQNYHSKFSPVEIIDALGAVDLWVTVFQPSSCTEVNDFTLGLKGHGYQRKGGAMLYQEHGGLDEPSCTESIFKTMAQSNATTMAFWSDFASMGDAWWGPMQSFLHGGNSSHLHASP